MGRNAIKCVKVGTLVIMMLGLHNILVGHLYLYCLSRLAMGQFMVNMKRENVQFLFYSTCRLTSS